MGIKRLVIAFCILLALSPIFISASATKEQAADKSYPALTVQVKSDWKSKAEAAKAKWKTLNAKQKAEIYDLMDQKAAAEIKVMEKYRDLGIIDDAVLTRFKEKLIDKMKQIKNSGELPLFAEHNSGPKPIPRKPAA